MARRRFRFHDSVREGNLEEVLRLLIEGEDKDSMGKVKFSARSRNNLFNWLHSKYSSCF